MNASAGASALLPRSICGCIRSSCTPEWRHTTRRSIRRNSCSASGEKLAWKRWPGLQAKPRCPFTVSSVPSVVPRDMPFRQNSSR